jgi:hypothetical protein
MNIVYHGPLDKSRGLVQKCIIYAFITYFWRLCVGTVTGWGLEVSWRPVEVGPSIPDDLCEFVWSCGGYHKRDRRKRNIPNAMNAARMVSIKKGSPFGTPLFILGFYINR